MGYAKLWRHMGSRRVRVMKKLDESKVEWIISQKQKGIATSSIVETMNVSARWVKKLWAGTSTPIQARSSTPPPWTSQKRPSLAQGVLCSAYCQNRGSSERRAPARDNKGKHQNRYSMQHHTQDVEGRRSRIRESKEEQEAQVGPL